MNHLVLEVFFWMFLIMYLFYLIWIELLRVSISYWMNFHCFFFLRIIPFHLNFLICFKYSFIVLLMAAEFVYIPCFIPDIGNILILFIFVSLVSIYQCFDHFEELALYISFCSIVFLFLILLIF